VLLLLVSGCASNIATFSFSGGGPQHPGVPYNAGPINGSASATADDGATVHFDLGDDAFTPPYVTAPAGAHLRVDLSNTGTGPHTFTMDIPTVDRLLEPGQKATIDLTLVGGGPTVFYCRLHRTLGMQGVIGAGV
jgi:plastocyanin